MSHSRLNNGGESRWPTVLCHLRQLRCTTLKNAAHESMQRKKTILTVPGSHSLLQYDSNTTASQKSCSAMLSRHVDILTAPRHNTGDRTPSAAHWSSFTCH